MEENNLIKNWFIWRETSSRVQADKQVIASSAVRFPRGYEYLLQYLISGSSFMAQACYRKLRKHGLQIVGEYYEHDEYFIMWKDRRQTGMVRITAGELKVEMQQKVESLIRTIGKP